jgi:hypothetical protein
LVVKLLAAHKAEVLAALAPTTPGVVEARQWGERFTALTFEWFGGKREWTEARAIVLGQFADICAQQRMKIGAALPQPRGGRPALAGERT